MLVDVSVPANNPSAWREGNAYDVEIVDYH